MRALNSLRACVVAVLVGACGEPVREDEVVTGPEKESTESIGEALGTTSDATPCTKTSGPLVQRTQGWRAMSFSGDNAWAAEGRMFHSATWTGTRMIVFGGDYGKGTPGFEAASYDPATDRFSHIPKSPLSRRLNHAAAWTGQELLIWGGNAISATGSLTASGRGARFNPQTCSWTAMATGRVNWRNGSTVVYATTTRELIMFGGALSGSATEFSRYGYAYSVDTDTWRKTARAPIAGRWRHGAIWTGTRMIVFGGEVLQNV